MSADDLHALPLSGGADAHLVLPFAACESEGWQAALTGLPATATANLRALLAGMQARSRQSGELRSLTPPHERLVAQEMGWGGLPDGLLPWAALQQAGTGPGPALPCAWVTLCHWAMGREHATLSDPRMLDLSEAESRALLETMRPFFEGDGIALHYLSPLRWRAEGLALEQPTASLDRVLGRNVDPWLPSAREARTLRRLQNEMQMLLYTHPVNQARAERGEPAINSLWFSGSGRLPAQHKAPPGLHMTRLLAAPALGEDAQAYAQAWAQLDAQLIAPLLEQQRQGLAVELTLCGERSWLRLQSITAGWLGRLVNSVSAPAWPQLLQDKP